MSKVYSVLAILFLVCLAGGLIFLATWDIPPPLHPVDKDVTAAALGGTQQAPIAPTPTGFH
jgi:hypothetical protein